MAVTVQIRQKGQFTIPVKMREQLGLEENDTVSVELLGKDAIVIIPKKLKIQEILEKTSQEAKKRGITLEAMLAELDEIRHKS